MDCTFPTRVFSRFIVSSRSSPVGAARAGSSSTRAHTQDGQETHYVARGARAEGFQPGQEIAKTGSITSGGHVFGQVRSLH